MSPHRYPIFALACGDIDEILDVYPLNELDGTRLFVTGCTGFLGYWLLSAIACLNRRGVRIEVIAVSRNPQAFLLRYPEFREIGWLTLIGSDVRHTPIPSGRIDAIIHAATDTSPQAAANPASLLNVMLDGTRRILEVCSSVVPGKFLFVSSGAVYGEQSDSVPMLEEDYAGTLNHLDLANAYGEGKRMMELLCICNLNEHIPAPVIARCFSFIGPLLPAHLAPAQFVSAVRNTKSIALQSDGTPLRSYLYSADLAIWLLALLTRGTPGRAYNVGGATPINLMDLANLTFQAIELLPNISTLDKGAQHPRRRYIPDTSRARSELGLNDWTPLPTAIARMFAAADLQQP